MKKGLFLLLLLSALSIQLSAQVKVRGQKIPAIYVFVEDSVTGEDLVEGTMVELLSADSVQIMAAAPVKMIYSPNTYFTALNPPSRTGTYLVRVTHEGYEPQMRRLTLKDGEVEGNRTFKMKRESKVRKLGEAVVRATKIKFYNKGDTLVYNADAFNLSEGSMLDALIEQLPGAELKRDGRIFVQGRQVESLLLNGRDFFSGNNSVMLENLPAYTVKDIKVYEKQSEYAELTGIKDLNPPYVMDVRLKKEYSIGWMTNFQAGLGTEDRWVGRLFAMRTTPQTSLTVFGNFNNTNETRKPGSNDVWQSTGIGNGRTVTQSGGLDYWVRNKHSKNEFNGNITATHTDSRTETRQTAEDFMPGGDNVFRRVWSGSQSKNLSLSTGHSLQFRFYDKDKTNSPQVAFLRLNPSFDYSHYDNRSGQLSGEFSKDPASYSGLRDSLSLDPIGTDLLRLLTNRVRNEQLSEGHSYSGSFSLYGTSNTMSRPISFNASVSGSRQVNESHDLYRLDYTDGTPSDNRLRFYDKPANTLNANASVGYSWSITEDGTWMLMPSLSYAYNHTSQDNNLYSLDELEEQAKEPLGTLISSMRDALLSNLDTKNSYVQTKDVHTVTLNLNGRYDLDILDSVTYQQDEKFRIAWQPRLILQRERMVFDGQKPGRPARTVLLPYLQLQMNRVTPGSKHKIDLTAEFSQSMPSLSYQLGVSFDNDPLNVSEWDADLRRTNNYSVKLAYRADKWLSARRQLLTAEVSFNAS